MGQQKQVSQGDAELNALKRENLFGEEFENYLAEHLATDDISAARELQMRRLFLATRSSQMIPQGSA